MRRAPSISSRLPGERLLTLPPASLTYAGRFKPLPNRPDSRSPVAAAVLLKRQRTLELDLDHLVLPQRLVALDLNVREVHEGASRRFGRVENAPALCIAEPPDLCARD